jgi:hypothetical protein
MEPVDRARLLAAGLVLALAACAPSAPAAVGRPQRPGRPGRPGLPTNHTSGGDDSETPTSTDKAPTKGDLKTFAYASTDGAALAAEVTSVLAPAAGGSVHYEGYELLSQAQRLESLAASATRRLKDVKPADRDLVGARRDGISAYALTAEFATLMVNLARADANDDLGVLNTAANQALALEGRGEELAAYYTAFIAELEKWQRVHPQAAVEAMKKYGG